VLDDKGPDHWHAVLNTEFGGMEDVLYRLYGLTGNKTHAGEGAGKEGVSGS